MYLQARIYKLVNSSLLGSFVVTGDTIAILSVNAHHLTCFEVTIEGKFERIEFGNASDYKCL